MSHRMNRLAARLPISILVGLLLIASLPVSASDASVDLNLYGRLLETHTRAVPDIVGTQVDYQTLSQSSDWKRLASQVRKAKPSGLSRDQKLAFWINAYNILAIDLIAQHYAQDDAKHDAKYDAITGIKDLGSFFSPVWSLEVAKIEGQSISLGHIEHKILRKMGEPRIHAAIVCASISCPPLARTPFRAETIDADLSAAMRAWLASREKGIAIDRTHHSIRLSKIFDWFEEDFEARGGVLVSIAPHLDAADAAWLRGDGANARIQYFGYNWSLNDLKTR